jgi:hypothetical protein
MIDAPARPAETHRHAPFDVLLPARCRRTIDGKACNARSDANIDWSRPGFLEFKCRKCGSPNVYVIVEATSAQSAGPL